MEHHEGIVGSKQWFLPHRHWEWSCVGFGVASNRKRFQQTQTKGNLLKGYQGLPESPGGFRTWKRGSKATSDWGSWKLCSALSRNSHIKTCLWWDGVTSTSSNLIVHAPKREPLTACALGLIPAPMTRYWWAPHYSPRWLYLGGKRIHVLLGKRKRSWAFRN